MLGRRSGALWYAVPIGLSLALCAGALSRLLALDATETFGFVTGIWGVWLQVRENVWNWPVQLVSSAFYVVVFFRARLFADTMLNVIYLGLYVLGWYWWLRGGDRRTALHIERLGLGLAAVLALVGVAATAGMTVFLTSVRDAAPFLDALTTVMSLIALFLIARKLFEAWWVWIAVNTIYVGLYLYKSLALTALLYAIFAVLSVAGWLNWWRLLGAQRARTSEAPAL